MTQERQFIVTVAATFQADIAVTASSEAEARRKALEDGPDSGELAGTPQRLTACVCGMREVGQCHATD